MLQPETTSWSQTQQKRDCTKRPWPDCLGSQARKVIRIAWICLDPWSPRNPLPSKRHLRKMAMSLIRCLPRDTFHDLLPRQEHTAQFVLWRNQNKKNSRRSSSSSSSSSSNSDSDSDSDRDSNSNSNSSSSSSNNNYNNTNTNTSISFTRSGRVLEYLG